MTILWDGELVWFTALGADCYLDKLESIYRLTFLTVASAYCTVSHDAVSIITGMMLISIIIRENVECLDLLCTRGIRSNNSGNG